MKIFTDEELERIVEILDPKDSEYGITYEIYPEDKLSKCGVFVPNLLENIRYYKEQLVKYGRIVEAARHWRETQANGTWKMQGGSKEIFDMLQIKVARRQALIDAVDDLKA